jgi:hypothetical protein
MTTVQALAIFFIGCFIVLAVFLFAVWHDKRKRIGECGCKLQCGYCKEIEASENNYSITEECKHPNQLTVVLASSVNCETTIEQCADCHEPLSEPITDCR